VARLGGCIHTLAIGARRLLTLRAGLDGPARSATATARILKVNAGRERRLERRALRLLARSASTGCEAAAMSVPAAVPAQASPAGTATTAAAGSSAVSGPSASLSAAHAERSPRGGRRVGAGAPPATADERASTGSSSAGAVLIPALLALLLGLALIALPGVRRRLLPAGAPVDRPRATAAAPVNRERAAPAQPQAPGRERPTRRPLPPSRQAWAAMDEGLALMAADAFAQMARDPGESDPHPQPEAETSHHEAQVEGEVHPGGEDRAG
jgi:hypothetical protein